MKIDVISIFPQYFAPLGLSLVGKAIDTGVLDVGIHDLREWTHDRHRTVDDTPYGGGAGMVMRPDVWGDAIATVFESERESETVQPDVPPTLVIPTPSGRPFSQAIARELAARAQLVFVCGRYEGIDARVAQHFRQQHETCSVIELSVGDYVLNGGEAATLIMIEAIVRLIPGVVGNPDSLVEESYGPDGLLEYPVFTKPRQWAALDVPEVLLSGDHGKIAQWRREQALSRTAEVRPDLIARLIPSDMTSSDLDTLRRCGWTVDELTGRFRRTGEDMAD